MKVELVLDSKTEELEYKSVQCFRKLFQLKSSGNDITENKLMQQLLQIVNSDYLYLLTTAVK